MQQIKNKYSIYLYADGYYGFTGISMEDIESAITKCIELKRLNDGKYGIFLEYKDDGIHHRRLVWKDGERVSRVYKKKISGSANILLNFLKAHYSAHRKYATYDEIKKELQKRDYDIIRLMGILLENELVTFTPPFNKRSNYRIINNSLLPGE